MFRYFQEAREELSKVTWPNREQVIEGTQAVLVFAALLTLFVFLLDNLFGFGIRQVLS